MFDWWYEPATNGFVCCMTILMAVTVFVMQYDTWTMLTVLNSDTSYALRKLRLLEKTA